MSDLAAWLRAEADNLTKQAAARRDTAKVMREASAEDLRKSKQMAEQMAGRTLDISANPEEAAIEALIQDRIAQKLETRAKQLYAWANLVGTFGYGFDKRTLRERLEARHRELGAQIGNEALEQKHLNENSPERAYWHYGYFMAIDDILCALKAEKS